MRRFINALPTQEDLMDLEEWVDAFLLDKNSASKTDPSMFGSILTNKRKFRRHFFQGEQR